MSDNEINSLLHTIEILSADRAQLLKQLTITQAEGTKLVMELRDLQKQLKEYETRRNSA